MIRKISAHYIFPVSSTPLKYGILVCTGNGEILDVIDKKGIFREEASLEFYDGILIPGFVRINLLSDHAVLEEMKNMQYQNPILSLEEIVRWATLDAAKTIQKEEKAGSFEIHKIPGVYLLTKIDFSVMKLSPTTEIRRIISQPEKY